MRGYEETDGVSLIPLRASYESPCGVMSIEVIAADDWSIQLRIPMRGYEILEDLARCTHVTSYESPCGVMSQDDGDERYAHWVLRIPMRGYEGMQPRSYRGLLLVTNPHAGL